MLGQNSVNDILIACTKQLMHFPDSIMRAPLRSVTIGTRFQIRLEDRLNQQFSGALNHSVPNSGNSEWALAAPRAWGSSPVAPVVVDTSCCVTPRGYLSTTPPILAIRYPRRSAHLLPARPYWLAPVHRH